MAWLTLFFAGLFEVAWATGLKLSDGMTKFVPASVTVVAMIISIGLLSVAMKTIPLGTAYTVWTGIGALGALLVGYFFFQEPLSPLRLISAVLIVAGLVGLKHS